MSALAVFIYYWFFKCAFCFIAFRLLAFVLVFSEKKYKPGCGGFGDITNSEPVVGGLFSCGKPQPISPFVSDEAAAQVTET